MVWRVQLGMHYLHALEHVLQQSKAEYILVVEDDAVAGLGVFVLTCSFGHCKRAADDFAARLLGVLDETAESSWSYMSLWGEDELFVPGL